MKIVLITGMSGTGKSTIILDLQSRGYPVVDLDCPPFSTWVDAAPDTEHPDNEVKPGKDWVWDEQRVRELLCLKDTELLFVSGCASNMSTFYSYFSTIVLLTAPESVIIERLKSRQVGGYGSSPGEIERVLRLRETIEPLLRRRADLEIDTSLPPALCTEMLLNHVRGLSL